MPLTKDEVKQYITSFGVTVRDRLGLQDWDVHYQFHQPKMDDNEAIGMCRPSWTYRRAVITIRPEGHDTIDELAQTLLHEHAHIIHGEFELTRQMMANVARDDSQEFNLYDLTYQRAAESVVKHIESIVTWGFGLTPRQFVEGVVVETTDEKWSAGVAPGARSSRGVSLSETD